MTAVLVYLNVRGVSESYVHGYPPIAAEHAARAIRPLERLKMYSELGSIEQVVRPQCPRTCTLS